jgi:xanthine permease
MYAGAVAVPLVVGAALGLGKGQLAVLISADLFTCGVATLLQTLGLGPRVGIRLPLMMGVTFVAVGPMIQIGQAYGLPSVYGAIIVSGLAMTFAAGPFSRLLRFFPDVVTGSIITVVGLGLLPVASGWAGGGAGAPDFGSPSNLALAGGVLALITLLTRYAGGFVSSIAVLIGLLAGSFAAGLLGKAGLEAVSAEPWFALPSPFWFGPPEFRLAAILNMLCVAAVCVVESTGVFIAMGRIAGVEVRSEDIARGLRAEGLASVAGSVLNSFPYITFGQNLGLVALTRVRSRFVVAAGGGMLMFLGTLPKLAALIASIPPSVLGGAGFALFGMVAASGIRTLSHVDYENPANPFIVAASLGVGMGISMEPRLFASLGPVGKHFLSNGIFMCGAFAVFLNWLFNLHGKPGR